MEKPKSYCEWLEITSADQQNPHKIYHDNHYGFPIDSDDELFGRLLLEIFQAGLSWTIILKKQENFRRAFNGFSVAAVAAYTQADVDRLLADPGIVRNRLKINAAIYNAGAILKIQSEYGSFKDWLFSNRSAGLKEWTKLFKKTFKFTGGEIVNEFLMSAGYLPGAHVPACPVYNVVLAQKPAWAENQAK